MNFRVVRVVSPPKTPENLGLFLNNSILKMTKANHFFFHETTLTTLKFICVIFIFTELKDRGDLGYFYAKKNDLPWDFLK